MSSKEILIDSTLIKNMENDISSAEMDTRGLTEKDTETTIAGNANGIECYDVCNNVVKAMNRALQNDAEKIANSCKEFNGFDKDVAKIFGKK